MGRVLGVGAVLMALLAAPAAAGTITLTNAIAGNFDGNSGTRGFTVTGLESGFGTGVIVDVDISINFAKADGQDFDPPYPTGNPYYNEIRFQLFAPSTEPVFLIGPGTFTSGVGTGFDGTITFDQSAADAVNAFGVPTAGTFRPSGAGSLNDFNGDTALGFWSLFIQDTAGSDSLRFRSATLTITTEDAELAPVPEPGTLSLFGLGAAAIVAARHRARR